MVCSLGKPITQLTTNNVKTTMEMVTKLIQELGQIGHMITNKACVHMDFFFFFAGGASQLTSK